MWLAKFVDLDRFTFYMRRGKAADKKYKITWLVYAKIKN